MNAMPSSSSSASSIVSADNFVFPWEQSAMSPFASEYAFKPEGYNLEQSLRLVKAFATAAFEETIEISMCLNVDPRKATQIVKGVAQLPYSFQKTVVAVFAKGSKADEAREAGADIVGAEDLATQISSGKIEFSRCLATPDMMAVVGRVGRILGPRGLMPNPKLGTVTMNLKEAIKNAKAGQVQFKTSKAGNVLAGVGKANFDIPKLKDNIITFVRAVFDAKPAEIKGEYVKKISLSSSQGIGIDLNFKAEPWFNEARKRKNFS
jgi:large subunit ribosomal protein L1